MATTSRNEYALWRKIFSYIHFTHNRSIKHFRIFKKTNTSLIIILLRSLSKVEQPYSNVSSVIVRLSLLRKTILIPEYLAFMCVCVFVDGCISQF